MDTNKLHSSPTQKTDLQTMRGSTLGQMHQGNFNPTVHHPALRFFLRVTIFLNVASWLGLWTAFRFKNFFPPHDAPFMSAIGWYFFFGAALCFFAVLVFSYAKKVEVDAIKRVLTNNRSYAWHSQHGTLKTHGAEQAVARGPVEKSVVGAGARQYRATAWLITISLMMWFMGAYAVLTDLF